MENSLSDEELLFLCILMHIKKEGEFVNIWTEDNKKNKRTIVWKHIDNILGIWYHLFVRWWGYVQSI